MLYPTEVKCTGCNIFYNIENYVINDIIQMKKNNKLIMCKKCKEYNMKIFNNYKNMKHIEN